jgi:hypothetical protein
MNSTKQATNFMVVTYLNFMNVTVKERSTFRQASLMLYRDWISYVSMYFSKSATVCSYFQSVRNTP